MHSGKGRHEVESAHKGKIIEDVASMTLLYNRLFFSVATRATIDPAGVCVCLVPSLASPSHSRAPK